MKPILFNTEMVRAILDGRKTVTRRVVKGINNTADFLELTENPSVIAVDKHGKEYPKDVEGLYADFVQDGNPEYPSVKAPYRPGDILYVRETWCDPSGTGYPFLYKADMPMHWDAENTEIGVPIDLKAEDYTWRPSIHMPKEAARLFLRVKDVRVERLRDITTVDKIREGMDPKDAIHTPWKWIEIWERTIKPYDICLYGRDINPWVWVIEFERVSKEEAENG